MRTRMMMKRRGGATRKQPLSFDLSSKKQDDASYIPTIVSVLHSSWHSKHCTRIFSVSEALLLPQISSFLDSGLLSGWWYRRLPTAPHREQRAVGPSSLQFDVSTSVTALLPAAIICRRAVAALSLASSSELIAASRCAETSPDMTRARSLALERSPRLNTSLRVVRCVCARWWGRERWGER